MKTRKPNYSNKMNQGAFRLYLKIRESSLTAAGSVFLGVKLG